VLRANFRGVPFQIGYDRINRMSMRIVMEFGLLRWEPRDCLGQVVKSLVTNGYNHIFCSTSFEEMDESSEARRVSNELQDIMRSNQTVSGMSVRNVSDPIESGHVDLVESFSNNREPVQRLFELMKRVVCSLEGLSDHQERKVAVNLSILSSTSATKSQPPHTDLAHKIKSSRVDPRNPRPWSFVFPVLESGSQLNVWGSEKEGSKLLRMPNQGRV
jgi:hypothetical protein